MTLIVLMAAVLAAGRMVGRLLPLGEGMEGWANRTAIGWLLCGLSAMAAGIHSILSSQVVLLAWIILGLIAEAAPRVYNSGGRRRKKRLPDTPKAPPSENSIFSRFSTFEWIGLLLLILGGGITFLGSFAPVSDPSATGESLALAKYYSQTKHLHFTPDIEAAGAPHLAYALYAVVWHGSGERPAALLGWFAAMAALVALAAMGKRIAGPKAGMAAALVFLAAPVFYDQAVTASVAPFQMLFTLCALNAVFAWHDDGDFGHLFLAGMMAGGAWATGHAGVLVVLLLPIAVWVGTGPAMAEAYPGDKLKGGLLALLFSLLIMAPFLARTWLFTGDPFYPWFQAWFPAKNGDHPFIAYIPTEALTTDWMRWLRYPWDVVMRPGGYDGWAHSPGGLIIALGVPALLWCGRRAWIAGGIAAAGILMLYPFQPGTLPALSFFALIMAFAGIVVITLPGVGRWAGMAILIFCTLFGLGMHGLRFYEAIPVLMGKETRNAYLVSQVPGYGLWETLNNRLSETPGLKVLSLDENAYYADSPIYTNRAGMEKIAQKNGEERLNWLRDKGINLLVIPERVLAPGASIPESVQTMLQYWRNTPAFFPLLDQLDFSHINGEGAERVCIYAVKTEF